MFYTLFDDENEKLRISEKNTFKFFEHKSVKIRIAR